MIDRFETDASARVYDPAVMRSAVVVGVGCLGLLACPGGQEKVVVARSVAPPQVTGRPGIGGARVVQLVAEDDNTCALLDDGEVACWGAPWGPYGAAPGRIPGLRDVQSVALGDDHLCALHRDGGVSCGGDNERNELAREPHGRAQPFARVDGLAGVTAIFAGDRDTCVLGAAGLTCWGDSYSSGKEPGRRSTYGQELHIREAGVSQYDNVWLTDSGQVLWWGAPLYYESHNGRYSTYPGAPLEVRIPGAARDVCAGSWHSCAIAGAGTVHCWGMTGAGAQRLGFIWNREWWPDSPEIVLDEIATPPAAVDVADAVELACGDHHTCARLGSGIIKCWGAPALQGAGPTEVYTARAVIGVTDAIQLAAGGEHTCALLGSGTIVCWGDLLWRSEEERLNRVPVEVPRGG